MLKTIFGTDGIRCQMNSSYLTEQNLVKLGRAISQWAPQNSRFIFGSDSRSSCKIIQAALSKELFKQNHLVSDAGTIPTPLLCKLVEDKKNYDFGIMITASHNPASDNGIKIITPTQKSSLSDELKISQLFKESTQESNTLVKKKMIANLNSFEIMLDYSEKIKKQLTHRKFDRFKIVVDCAHGATSFFAPEVFNRFGFETIVINNDPDGTNINQNSGALHPQQLIDHVIKQKADFGCAFDGDGDRIVIVTPQKKILNGDDLLAIFAQHPRYKNETVFAGTIMSNQAVEQFFKDQDKNFVRTDVGDKHIVSTLTQKNGLLGAEPSGHVIIKDHSFCSDGIFASLLFFDTLLSSPELQIPLFTPYPSVKKNIIVQEKKDLQAPEIAETIKLYKKELAPGRLIIRYSGTEPLLRVSCEHTDQQLAEKTLNNLVTELKLYLCL